MISEEIWRDCLEVHSHGEGRWEGSDTDAVGWGAGGGDDVAADVEVRVGIVGRIFINNPNLLRPI